MPASSARRPLLLVGVVSLGALVWCLGEIGRGAPPLRQDDAPGVKPDLPQRYNPAATCVRCHNVAEGAANPLPPYQRPPLVRYDEYRIWMEQDKHKVSYAALTGERGKRMGQLLGTGGQVLDVTKHDACLACHAPGALVDTADLSPEDLDARKTEGVSCVSCHGVYNAWVQNHWNLDAKWREKDLAEKQRDFGMTPVRDPAERSRMCLSCHAGNAQEGKVITHTMYAAGHPPLPSFDPATFSQVEPPHWWAPEEVPAFKGDKATPELLARFHANLGELHQTKLAVLGGAVALREAMRLLASQASAPPPDADAPPSPTGGQGWPELALFDCYACHHDLKAPGYQQWRQLRGFEHRLLDGRLVPGPAGRPQIRSWPTALVRAAIDLTGGDTETIRAFDSRITALYAASDARPFGSAPDLVKAANDLASWADGLIAKLEATPFKQEAVPGLLRALISLPVTEAPEYDSARQIAWAFQVIYSEWDPKPASQIAIQKILDRMRTRLKLDPFQSRAQYAQAADPDDPDQADRARLRYSETELVATLTRAADYSPITFKADLQKLLLLLPPQ